jgi:hypothetical protein
MKATLQRADVLSQDAAGFLVVRQPFFYSRRFDEDFIPGIVFSSSNLGWTLAHIAFVHQRLDLSNEEKRLLGRLERVAWSEHLSEEGTARFKKWVDEAAPRFLNESNRRIAENELPRTARAAGRPRATGIGVYYFQED